MRRWTIAELNKLRKYVSEQGDTYWICGQRLNRSLESIRKAAKYYNVPINYEKRELHRGGYDRMQTKAYLRYYMRHYMREYRLKNPQYNIDHAAYMRELRAKKKTAKAA